MNPPGIEPATWWWWLRWLVQGWLAVGAGGLASGLRSDLLKSRVQSPGGRKFWLCVFLRNFSSQKGIRTRNLNDRPPQPPRLDHCCTTRPPPPQLRFSQEIFQKFKGFETSGADGVIEKSATRPGGLLMRSRPQIWSQLGSLLCGRWLYWELRLVWIGNEILECPKIFLRFKII